jgi:hypothetical protein
MIHIEKISLKKIKEPAFQHQHYNSQGQTFVEYLAGVTPLSEDEYKKKMWRFNNINLIKHINAQLPQKLSGVSIGKWFGKTGIDLDELLLNPPKIENLVIEIPIDYLSVISVKRLKLLFESHTIMLNDFEEFCCTYGVYRPHIITFLTKHNIKPKCLFLVGAAFQLDKEYKELNIYTIPFEHWLLVSVSVQNFFLDAVTNKAYKKSMLSELTHQPKKNEYFCAVPVLKPRKHRLELLAHLDKIGILDHCDWSCALNQSKRFNNYALPATYKSTDHNNIFDSFTEDELTFLNNHSFPKELKFDELWKLSDSPYSAIPTITAVDWFNQYKFILVSETYIGNEMDPIMGGCGTLSEKTFKSFLYGSSVVIHGGKGSVDQLLNLGFKSQFGNYDSSNVQEIGKLMQEIQQNPVVDNDITIHNFDRITDLEFLTSLVTTPLNKIAELINSIRR